MCLHFLFHTSLMIYLTEVIMSLQVNLLGAYLKSRNAPVDYCPCGKIYNRYFDAAQLQLGHVAIQLVGNVEFEGTS